MVHGSVQLALPCDWFILQIKGTHTAPSLPQPVPCESSSALNLRNPRAHRALRLCSSLRFIISRLRRGSIASLLRRVALLEHYHRATIYEKRQTVSATRLGASREEDEGESDEGPNQEKDAREKFLHCSVPHFQEMNIP